MGRSTPRASISIATVFGRVFTLSSAARYGVAIVAALVAIVSRRALDPVWGLHLPFITLFPAVMLSAWLGGLGPGIVTTLICAVAAEYYWIEPAQSWLVAEKSELLGLLLFAAVGAVISVLNEAWRRGAIATVESEQRLGVTLASIGDAVITTDDQGRISRLNAIAEQLTGWSAADAVGRPLHDVFVILDELSRQPAASPVDRVIAEGVITGLANHTLLVSKDGREIAIDDSAAPIRALDGGLIGVVMVFRDITERRRLEQDQAARLERERDAHGAAQLVAQKLRHLQALTDIALSRFSLETLMPAVLTRLVAAIGTDTATILIVDEDGTHLKPVAAVGLEAKFGKDIRIPLGHGVAGRIALSESPLVFDDLADTDVIGDVLPERVHSLAGVRLKVGAHLLGVMHTSTTARRRFSDADIELLSLAADRTAIAIERARLYETEQAARRDAETKTEQLRVALEASLMGTWEYTIGTGNVKWSPGLEAIHGFSPGTFPETFDAFRDEIHPADRDRVLNAIRQSIEERGDHHVEYRIVRADGTVRWVEGRGQLFSDREGKADRMVGVCLDVTDRKRAEERFQLAVEAAPTAMIMVDRLGTIVLANALTEKLLGYSRDEIVGQPVDRLVPGRFRTGHPELRSSFFAKVGQRPMGAGRNLHAVRKDGSEVPVEIGLSPIETEDGLFVLAAVTDITERQRIEEERAHLLRREQAARTEIEHASQLKDEFLAVLSHELRTPLNAVLGYAHLLGAGILTPEKSRHAIEAIQRNARAQARLVESLLDLSRIIAGKLELNLEPIAISQIIPTAVDAIRPDADAKGIAIEVELPQAEAALTADGGRLQQVLLNLLSNAVKFTSRAGRVTIRVIQTDLDVQIEVSDSGQGISPEFLPHVFDRFKQASSHVGQATSGLGLGLALVREIVEAHEGSVAAESLGESCGSTFRVTIPRSLRPTMWGRLVRSGDQTVEPRLPFDILIVDDHGDVRELLRLLLESRGARVRAVPSAAEAINSIAERRPDVLLADLRMPEQDGYALIRLLRGFEHEPGVRRISAIAVTAYASATDREKAIAAGYDGHVAKPVDPEVLAKAIAAAVKTVSARALSSVVAEGQPAENRHDEPSDTSAR